MLFYINTKEQATLKVLKLRWITIFVLSSQSPLHSHNLLNQPFKTLIRSKNLTFRVDFSLCTYYIRNISWKLRTNKIGIILSSEKIYPQYEVVMGSSWGKSFFWKKNLNQKQQKKPANSAASSQKPLRYQDRRKVKNFGGTSQLVGHNLPTPTPWLEKGEFA